MDLELDPSISYGISPNDHEQGLEFSSISTLPDMSVVVPLPPKKDIIGELEEERTTLHKPKESAKHGSKNVEMDERQI